VRVSGWFGATGKEVLEKGHKGGGDTYARQQERRGPPGEEGGAANQNGCVNCNRPPAASQGGKGEAVPSALQPFFLSYCRRPTTRLCCFIVWVKAPIRGPLKVGGRARSQTKAAGRRGEGGGGGGWMQARRIWSRISRGQRWGSGVVAGLLGGTGRMMAKSVCVCVCWGTPPGGEDTGGRPNFMSAHRMHEGRGRREARGQRRGWYGGG
jgi:hypothetical protein